MRSLFTSLRGYRIGWLPRDLVAGLMLTAIAIPGQLATARLAGMPPQTGLYAFAAGSLAFAAFGANRFMSVGADSTIAPIFAGGLAAITAAGTANYAELAALLAILVGIILVTVGLLRAGWLATVLSIPVTTGFLAGISIHIIVGELPTLLGVSAERGHVLVRLVHALGRIGEANPCTLALGAGVLIVTLGTARISSRVPGALIALAGAGLAVALFHLDARGVSLLGALSVPLPRLTLPALAGIQELSRMVQLALVVAMVCIMQTAAVAGTFPSEEGKPDNVSRDFAAVGAGSILAGLIGLIASNWHGCREAPCGGRRVRAGRASMRRSARPRATRQEDEAFVVVTRLEIAKRDIESCGCPAWNGVPLTGLTNVVTSRANCVSILVGSPRIFEAECRTLGQIQLANAFRRYLEMAKCISPAEDHRLSWSAAWSAP